MQPIRIIIFPPMIIRKNQFYQLRQAFSKAQAIRYVGPQVKLQVWGCQSNITVSRAYPTNPSSVWGQISNIPVSGAYLTHPTSNEQHQPRRHNNIPCNDECQIY